MDLKEVKGIVNHIDIDDTKEVRVQINYGDGSGHCYQEIKGFTMVNGSLVFIVDANVVPQYR